MAHEKNALRRQVMETQYTDGWTQSEMARFWKLSRQRVSQLWKRWGWEVARTHRTCFVCGGRYGNWKGHLTSPEHDAAADDFRERLMTWKVSRLSEERTANPR